MADHSDLGFTPAPAANAHADLGFTPATQNVLDDPNNKLVGSSDGIPVYKYQPGSFLHETVENPVRQVGAGVEGAAAAANHLTANVFDLLDKAADGISKVTGLSKGGLFAHIKDWATQNEQAQLQKQQELSGGRSDFASQLYRGGTEGLLELPQYAVATHVLGPAAGMAALGAINEEDQGWKAALTAAAQGALTGKALEVMGPASRKIRLTGAAAMAYAQARFNGADNATALANAVSMGGMNAMAPGGMGVKDIAKMGLQQGVEALQDTIGRRVGRKIQSNLNPQERAAVDDFRDEGVPMRAGVQTGSKFLQSAEGATAATPLGSQDAGIMQRATEEGVQALGGRRLNAVSPEPATMESAAQKARGILQGKIEGLADEKDSAYTRAWQGRNDPQYTYDMPVRSEPEIGEDGKPTGKMRDVREPVNMPVDMQDIKELAGPIHEELDMKLSHSDQAQSAAFGVLEKIVQGKLPRYVPAWMAEHALSALKTLSRTDNQTGVRDYGQGVAAHLIPALQNNIDDAVRATGEDSLAALKEGRSKHAAMMDIVDVAEKLRKEPVQAFGQMTQRQDTGIRYLRQVADLAPDAMPGVARAWFQRRLDLLFREGGIQRTKEVLNDWRDLGDETKKILVPDAELRQKWDNFFKGVDLQPNRANTSGTEVMRKATSTNPYHWLMGYAGGKVLFTPRGIDLLTQGLKVPENSTRGRMIQKELKDMGAFEKD